MSHPFKTQAWYAEDVRQDDAWVLRMTPTEIAGFEAALQHAKRANKPLLEMTQADFPLPLESQSVLRRAIASTQDRWGMCLIKGFPVDRWNEAETRMAYWGMSLYMGVGRTQNRASEIINDVRDIGASYKVKNGRGYNTNAKLDFHSDGSDIVGLICVKQAIEGGNSMVTHSIRAFRALQQERPDLAECLMRPFVFSRQGEQASDEAPYYRASVVGEKNGQLFCRHIRNHINSAQLTFDDIERLTPLQTEALDRFDQMLQREDFRERMDKGLPVRAHEIQYPIMQGWDSVMIQADKDLALQQVVTVMDIAKRLQVVKLGISVQQPK